MGEHHTLEVHDGNMGVSSVETQQQRELAEKLRHLLEKLFTTKTTEIN